MTEQLRKVLSFRAILLITLNSVMGTGIFFLFALGAKHAGPASLIAWVIVSLLAIYMAMVFGELTSMFPSAGGVYEFCKNAYNSFWAFMIGWVTFITSNVTIAMLIVGAIQYLIPIHVPYVKIAIAIGFIILFHVIAHLGMKTSATMLVAFAVITLTTLAMIIFPSLFHFQLSNFDPFFIFPLSALAIASLAIIETFFGWETATFLAGETIDGERNVPRALVISTMITSVFALLVAAVSMGAVNWNILAQASAPLAVLSSTVHNVLTSQVFSIMVYLSLIGSVAGWVVASPRLILSMAQDKLFLSQLSRIHPRFNTPYRAIWFQAIFVIILILVSSAAYETILYLLLPLAILQYGAVIIALLVLRKRLPDRARPFRLPLAKTGSALTLIALGGIIVFWILHEPGAWVSLRLAGSIIFAGIPLYFLLKVYYDPEAIIKLNDTFAYLAYLTEKFSLPPPVKREILMLIGDVRGKTILEYGCSIGTLTIELATKVSAKGRIFATNISAKELEISKQRIIQRGHEHVVFIHDEHQANRVHPQVPRVDAIISFGMLGYIQDVNKVLSEMNDILKDGGRLVMVDWINFFHIIPDVEWLTHDELIRSVFKKAGFSVTVTRKRGILWDYLYVHGVKSNESILYV